MLIGQRLVENDPGGWARQQGFEVLSLPTEFDPDNRSKTRIWQDWRTERGELLNPRRMGPVEVAKAKRILGPYRFSAQHNQRPVPAGGGVIKLGWLQHREALPRSGYGALFTFWDTAFGDKEENDQSGRVVLGLRTDGNGVDILHAYGYRLKVHALEAEVVRDAKAWRPNLVGIEEKASGIVLVQNLETSKDFPAQLLPIKVKSGFGKDTRAHAATPFFARGLVGIDWNAPWTEPLREQLQVFPGGKVRDIADALIHGVLYVQETYHFEADLMAEEAGPATEGGGAFPPEPEPLPVPPLALVSAPQMAPTHYPEDDYRSGDYDGM
jgi:phage terminase large subunit-like protein